jgi:surface antigen
MIKKALTITTAVGLALTTTLQSVAAQPRGPDRYDRGYSNGYEQGYRAGYDDGRANHRFDDTDYTYGYGYDNGPPGAYVQGGSGNYDRDQRWRQRYARTYTYNDDNFYQECREKVDPAGVIAGALIGGLLGNAVSRGGARGAGTVAGVVVGGVAGAALTRSLDCEDRSYAYRTYSDGFNAGRPNVAYQWRNPRNGHYGTFRVRDYYNDPDGFRCANYTQQIFVNGQPQAATGRACQQPDGTWAIVS